MAELRPYDPTFRDKIAAALMGEARPGSARANIAEGLMGSRGIGTTGAGLADFTPVGIPMAVQESRRDMQAGNAMGATLNAMAVIPAAKVATEPVKTTTQRLAKALSYDNPTKETPVAVSNYFQRHLQDHGFSVEREGSKQSKSEYLYISHPSNEDFGTKKIRISDHNLPQGTSVNMRHDAADFDFRSRGGETVDGPSGLSAILNAFGVSPSGGFSNYLTSSKEVAQKALAESIQKRNSEQTQLVVNSVFGKTYGPTFTLEDAIERARIRSTGISPDDYYPRGVFDVLSEEYKKRTGKAFSYGSK